MNISENAFPNSWYPLCRSIDLRSGKVRTCFALGERFAVFRTVSGKVGALQAVCCHMGANLAFGHVRGEALCCPMHHWEYSHTGQCTHIPIDSNIPRRTKQQSLLCVEHYGLVFAWLGEEDPSFQPPVFPLGEKFHIASPRHFDFDAPYQTGAANAYDQHHLHSVHRREVIDSPKFYQRIDQHFGIEFQANIIGRSIYDHLLISMGKKQVHISIDCWGGNLLLMNHLGTPNHMMIALLPITHKRTRMFAVTLTPRLTSPVANFIFGKLMVNIMHHLTMMFVKQDFRVLRGMHLKPNILLPKADDSFIRWFHYWEALPRTSLAQQVMKKTANQKRAERIGIYISFSPYG
ncbi:MAG: Rieske 2Fe-2S domain-containing protein [Zetaproteobacteria bacterium]|nr:Rieske 2Fe-2S domain-containing protein [Zetaproteobacteria bacterium]